jgi:23S rRNA (cytosine1962-C5)-methyltransferase
MGSADLRGSPVDAADFMPDRWRVHDVVLQPGRDRSPRRRHPWVMSGSVARVVGEPEPGAWVRVVSAEGESLGFGHWSPVSQIRVRLFGFGKEAPGDALIAERIAAAVARRAGQPLLADTDAVRLANAEGDGLPGLTADRYGEVVVVRLSSAGMAARRELVSEALRAATGAAAGLERADAPALRREGVTPREGPLWGESPAAPVEIRERGRRYAVDLLRGQKTGFYLDQRDSRDLVEALAPGRRVLDLFSYTGGFAAAAARGGAAEVVLVDASLDALALARENLARNAPAVPARCERGDAFEFVRGTGERFDLIVVDPPPLARRQADVQKAARAYKDVLLHALRCAEPGAWLLAFACSHHVDPVLFRQIAFGASLDAGRPLRVLRELGAPVDHPVALDHPEGRYLTGLLLEA